MINRLYDMLMKMKNVPMYIYDIKHQASMK